MIIAIDVGNSNMSVGCLKDSEILFVDRLSTNRSMTGLEYAIQLKNALEVYGVSLKDFTGGIISSVVPEVTSTLKRAIFKLLGVEPMVVGPGLKTGLAIRIDNPAQLGANLLVGSVAALAEHSAPLVVIDLDTATTFGVVNKNRQYIGGVVFPGVRTGLDSLVANTSLLQQIPLEIPKKVIGSNTIDAMKSGVIHGNAAMIDGMLLKIERELGEKCTVVVTGNQARKMAFLCEHAMVVDDHLLLKGLCLIYEKNK